LIYSTESRLPVRILTLLFPTKDPLAPPPPVSPLGEGGPGPAGLLFDDEDEMVRFDDPDGVTVHLSSANGIGEA
ncbi:MAG TPA: hypothetical protein VLM91_17515, partial [Candidatus Methylomirabilis sp.]|nr:hypothetical protein [Candidatus Methylomirabilis sp.]